MGEKHVVMQPAVVFVWEHFGAYHVDRLAAVGASAHGLDVVGVEVASGSETYAWRPTVDRGPYRRITLFPGRRFEQTGASERLRKLLEVCRSLRPGAVFLCNLDRADTIVASYMLRALGWVVVGMIDGKYDDSPRRSSVEVLKRAALRQYSALFVAGARHRSYYEFLGYPARRIHLGYDTVDVERVRREAGTPPAPSGERFASRHFAVVARFVPKKNIELAIRAYAVYRDVCSTPARRLVICGSGALERDLRALIDELGLEADVQLAGFLDSAQTAHVLGKSVALVVTSSEEQWGLVVNEGLAMGLPILCTDVVGARDELVRAGINGFVFEPDNPEGLARLMAMVADDERLWRAMAHQSLTRAPLGDVRQFVHGVHQCLQSRPDLAQAVTPS